MDQSTTKRIDNNLDSNIDSNRQHQQHSMVYVDNKRRKTSKTCLTVALTATFVALLYITCLKYTRRNTIRVELTSKSTSKLHVRNENSQKYEEIQHMIEQTEKLSFDLSKEFDEDLRKMGYIPQKKKIQHRDYLYHPTDKKLEQKICQKPYQLLVLCLDDTNEETRTLYRDTWAAKRNEILTSDGVMPVEWKVIFVVDVPDHSKFAFEKELRIHKDVIGFTGVKNAPRKEILKLMTAFEWVDQHCEFSFLVKMKNGTFLNTPKMFSFLRDPRVPVNELFGGVVVYQHNNTITFHTQDKKLVKGYPRFIKDAFIMSFDVVNKVISKFHWLKPHADADVYIGELVLQSGIDVWPVPNLLYHDTSGKCATFNMDGILIQCADKCARIFNKESLKIIPEV